MDETYITGEVMKRSPRIIRGAKILKHCDKATSAIPDVSMSWCGFTFWIEMKYLRRRDTLMKIVDMDQLIMCNELAVTTDGRCWIVVYQEHPKQITIWTPQVLFNHLYPKLSVGGPWKAYHREPVESEWSTERPLGLAASVKACGAVRIPGWSYDVVAHLVKQAAS